MNRATRSLVKVLGGDDQNVRRQSARTSSKPSDRTRSISASTASLAETVFEEMLRASPYSLVAKSAASSYSFSKAS